jgi:tRNA(adenine34) deaminase
LPDKRDIFWMNKALDEAAAAFTEDEVPVGAVLVLGEECLAKAHDIREKTGDPTSHAEILAIREASEKIGDWRLCDCELYVTLEPCPMCTGAILMSRIKRLIYGAPNFKGGAVKTHCSLLSIPTFNHKVEVRSGVLEEECADLLKKFFSRKR